MVEDIIFLPINICRVCANLQSSLNILTETLEDEHVLLHEALEFVSCIRIDLHDGMSRTMCLTCRKRLSDAYKFKNQVLDSYRAYYNQTSDLKFEKESPIDGKDSETTVLAAESCMDDDEYKEPEQVIECANKFGIKLSTNALSFLFKHNNSKSRNNKEHLSVGQNKRAEDITTNKDKYELILLENNKLDSIEALPMEQIATEETETTIEQIKTEENELPAIENNQPDNIDINSMSIRHNQDIDLPTIKNEVNIEMVTPYSRSSEGDQVSSNRKNLKHIDLKIATYKETKKNKCSCYICHKILPKRSNLRDHMRLHANEKNFVCSFCQKAFVQVANYRTHLRIHTKERPYQCHICPKTYSQAGSLKTHIRSHTNERNYVCDVCYKGFTNSSDLGKHKRIHDLSLHVACEACGHLFSQKTNLMLHMRKVHLSRTN